jgi:hypothetical protein
MSTQHRVIQSQQQNQDITQKTLLAIKGIRFGSVELVIHDSNMVQIEREEKIRFNIHQSQPSQ